MAAPTLTRGRVRRLAELRPERGLVLSVFLDLDPGRFATAPARSTAIASLMHDAEHRVADADGIDAEDRLALREDLERVREALNASDLATGGTKGVAVYACGPADLLEVVRLPHPVASRAYVNHSPFVEPLVAGGLAERWCVLLTTRRDARILLGSADGFDEVERFSGAEGDSVEDRAVQHTTERAADQHLRAVGERLSKLLKAEPFDHLLIGAPDELKGTISPHLHAYVKDKLVGRLHVDVENVTPDGVRDAAAPVIEEHLRTIERTALDRFAQEAGRGGRAAAGLEATLAALEEQRVELLLLEAGFSTSGTVDEDVVEAAIERALEQSADVLMVRRFPDLGTHGGIGALLRF